LCPYCLLNCSRAKQEICDAFLGLDCQPRVGNQGTLKSDKKKNDRLKVIKRAKAPGVPPHQKYR
jgi:hypothetical protein